jgi:heme-degrading monooxygenase HmoA
MIARVWSGQTTPSGAAAYVEHLRTQVFPTLKKVAGYRGAMLLERAVSGAVEVVVITFWQSVESLRSFAGDDLERAVVADEAAALLTQFDRQVRHYTVSATDDV